MSRYYILNDEGDPVPVDNVVTWGRWFETAQRHVAETHMGGVRVSTVFLGMDHSFGGGGKPILWETCVFNSPDGSDHMDRYTSREDAERGHTATVQCIRNLQSH